MILGEPNVVECDPNQLRLKGEGGLEAEAHARGVTMSAETGSDPAVRCAPEKVERVLLNHDPRLGVTPLDLLLRPDQPRQVWIASSIRG